MTAIETPTVDLRRYQIMGRLAGVPPILPRTIAPGRDIQIAIQQFWQFGRWRDEWEKERECLPLFGLWDYDLPVAWWMRLRDLYAADLLPHVLVRGPLCHMKPGTPARLRGILQSRDLSEALPEVRRQFDRDCHYVLGDAAHDLDIAVSSENVVRALWRMADCFDVDTLAMIADERRDVIHRGIILLLQSVEDVLR